MAVLLLIGTACFSFSCGKKAPPEPPERIRLPAVDDLSLTREDSRVLLSWTLKDVAADALRDLSGFLVLRARRDPPPIGCETCPLDYELVGDVAYGNGTTIPKTWYFEDIPVGGFKYYYKVRGYSVSGTVGPDSKTVDVLVPGKDE